MSFITSALHPLAATTTPPKAHIETECVAISEKKNKRSSLDRERNPSPPPDAIEARWERIMEVEDTVGLSAPVEPAAALESSHALSAKSAKSDWVKPDWAKSADLWADSDSRRKSHEMPD